MKRLLILLMALPLVFGCGQKGSPEPPSEVVASFQDFASQYITELQAVFDKRDTQDTIRTNQLALAVKMVASETNPYDGVLRFTYDAPAILTKSTITMTYQLHFGYTDGKWKPEAVYYKSPFSPLSKDWKLEPLTKKKWESFYTAYENVKQ